MAPYLPSREESSLLGGKPFLQLPLRLIEVIPEVYGVDIVFYDEKDCIFGQTCYRDQSK